MRIQKTEVGAIRRVALFKELILTAETQYPQGIKGRGGNMKYKTGRGSASPLQIIIILLSMVMLSACGGGGGSSPTAPTAPTTTVTFSGSSSGYNVYMSKNSSLSSVSVLAIDIMVSGATNVFGAAFDVDFDSTKMTYSGYSAGNFLETGGNSVTYIATQAVNKLIVGVSRQAPSGGQSGSGTLVTLKFNVIGGGSVSFSNNALKDASNPPQTVSASWSPGGTVTVQ